MIFNANIKLMRQRRKLTQDHVAGELGISRSTLNSYENGSVQNPTLEMLMSFSKYFRVSIDTLVKLDLSKLSEFQLSELERGHDVYVTGARLRVLATTVDSNNRENIEVVPIKAKAGYKNGFADPEFIQKLPTFQLPILFGDRKSVEIVRCQDHIKPFLSNSSCRCFCREFDLRSRKTTVSFI